MSYDIYLLVGRSCLPVSVFIRRYKPSGDNSPSPAAGTIQMAFGGVAG
jgi:hypothetical protein